MPDRENIPAACPIGCQTERIYLMHDRYDARQSEYACRMANRMPDREYICLLTNRMPDRDNKIIYLLHAQ
jgi:hypothetical protein